MFVLGLIAGGVLGLLVGGIIAWIVLTIAFLDAARCTACGENLEDLR